MLERNFRTDFNDCLQYNGPIFVVIRLPDEVGIFKLGFHKIKTQHQQIGIQETKGVSDHKS